MYTLLVATPGSRFAAAAVIAGVVLLYGMIYWVFASRLGSLPQEMSPATVRRRRAGNVTVSW